MSLVCRLCLVQCHRDPVLELFDQGTGLVRIQRLIALRLATTAGVPCDGYCSLPLDGVCVARIGRMPAARSRRLSILRTP